MVVINMVMLIVTVVVRVAVLLSMEIVDVSGCGEFAAGSGGDVPDVELIVVAVLPAVVLMLLLVVLMVVIVVMVMLGLMVA